jgi:hypothetical protein
MTDRIAIVTPSYAPDFELCRELNASVLAYLPAPMKHYLIVDGADLALFRQLENARTVVVAVEDVIPKGYHKLRYPRKWWFSSAALFPAKGWLIQQLAKLSIARVADEPVLVNVDSDVRFVRRIETSLFSSGGKTRMYRLPGGVLSGMPHVKWNKNVSRLLGVPADEAPMDDYVGNVISWDRRIVLDACKRIEEVTGLPWHVAYTRARLVGEQLVYGLYVDKVVGRDGARVWSDERSWCHTYWGPAAMSRADIAPFVATMRADDIAFSIAGYTATPDDIASEATRLVLKKVADDDAVRRERGILA